MPRMRWQWGDAWALAIGLFLVTYAWGLGGTQEATKVGILVTASYLAGRSVGAHR